MPFRIAFRRLFAIRLLGTVSFRYPYPFLATIADGLDTGIATIGVGIAAGEVAGLVAPLFGRRLDRVGRARGMVDGSALAAVGCLLVALAPNPWVFGAGFFVVAIGRFTYDVSFGAWVGDEVPFERRGFATGIGELAWSGAFLVGMPAAGLLTSTIGWRAPFVASAVLLVAAIPVIRISLTTEAPPPAPDASAVARARPSRLHAAIFLFSLGAALLFVTEGAWFEEELGLTTRAISVVVVLLGIGEVVGAILSAGLADRIGKRNAMVLGMLILVPAAGTFALAGSSQVVGVAAAIGIGLGFELAFVSALPLVVEIDSSQRAGAMSLAVAALTSARTLAAVAGTAVFDDLGIGAVVALSVPALAAGLLVLVFVREPTAPAPASAG